MDDDDLWDLGGLTELPDKGEPSLGSLSPAMAAEVAMHPSFVESANQVAELIAQVRECATDTDLHDFQNDLLAARLAAEDQFIQADRAMTRVERRKAPHRGCADARERGRPDKPASLEAGAVRRQPCHPPPARGWRHPRLDCPVL